RTTPPTLSRPPSIAAGNALRPQGERPAGAPWTTATTTPATAETVAGIAHAMAKTLFTDMTSDCATCWLNAVARMARPYLDRRKNHAIPTIIANETARLIR